MSGRSANARLGTFIQLLSKAIAADDYDDDLFAQLLYVAAEVCDRCGYNPGHTSIVLARQNGKLSATICNEDTPGKPWLRLSFGAEHLVECTIGVAPGMPGFAQFEMGAGPRAGATFVRQLINATQPKETQCQT